MEGKGPLSGQGRGTGFRVQAPEATAGEAAFVPPRAVPVVAAGIIAGRLLLQDFLLGTGTSVSCGSREGGKASFSPRLLIGSPPSTRGLTGLSRHAGGQAPTAAALLSLSTFRVRGAVRQAVRDLSRRGGRWAVAGPS